MMCLKICQVTVRSVTHVINNAGRVVMYIVTFALDARVYMSDIFIFIKQGR